jgi:hypothetical protein
MFDISNIDFSWVDKRKKIILPKTMTEELAEDIGIHIGDGSMYLSGPSKKSYILRYSGHFTEDKEHYLKRIIPLKKALFNVKATGKVLNCRNNEFGIVICSKAIYNFYLKAIGIPSGKKCKIADIPEIIKNSSKEIQCSFIRGLADTDFSVTFKRKSTKHDLNYYPVISADFASKKLIKSLKSVLTDLGFNVVTLDSVNKRYEKSYKTHVININGRSNLEHWMKQIGFSNPNHLTKYLIWKKYGFCPPYTTILERKQILKGDINPYIFYRK